jgi:hypothetical protein
MAIIDPSVPPSGFGCIDCEADAGWWLHLRRCAACGHVGCCDSSPSQHATAHAAQAGHPIAQSFEPGEDWFWNYATADFVDSPQLAAPTSHPLEQPAPGPLERLPEDWMSRLNA